VRRFLALAALGASLVGLSACTGNTSGANLLPKTQPQSIEPFPVSIQPFPVSIQPFPVSIEPFPVSIGAFPVSGSRKAQDKPTPLVY
jgi:hypothetical protein